MSENAPDSDNDQSTDTPKSSSGTSEADADHTGGTASPDGATLGGISDDQLPDDLQPGEDNPLAEPLDPDAEETKDRDELEMDATQEDLGNPPVESSSDSDSDSDPDPGEEVDDESDQSDGPAAG
ncbi:hypothetical protein [Nocardioides baculatus]|uniref:Chemotaxis protein n=1 Tax=Nocardioides baculatus TaxID=2801337 RepID=A0ABS1LDJ7_9ACTN|nr:hypothetical protein [Nocardioides baculatus]MBL0749627.1 hypothetical protein [Nocardioides baculatus]